MPPLLTLFATATAWLSAFALYRASPHSRGEAGRWRAGNPLGLVLAAVSLASWILALGTGAGISVMLASWMLGLVASPYLAYWLGPAHARGRH